MDYFHLIMMKRLKNKWDAKKKKKKKILIISETKNGVIDHEKRMRKFGFKERGINTELVKRHFFFFFLGDVLKSFRKSKINSERNKIQVSIIKNGLRNLKEEITDMSKEQKKIENLNEIIKLAEKFLEFNRQQQGQDLKILTPNQMLSRLPISLA